VIKSLIKLKILFEKEREKVFFKSKLKAEKSSVKRQEKLFPRQNEERKALGSQRTF
jgi:hypothetical protein